LYKLCGDLDGQFRGQERDRNIGQSPPDVSIKKRLNLT